MQPNARNYADFLRIGLDIGVCFQSDVVGWADCLIEQYEYVEEWMIDLSTSSNKHILDVCHLLDDVPGTPNLEVSFRLLMAQFGQRYPTIHAEHEHIQLLRNLYRLVHTEISAELKAYIYTIDSDLDWLEGGEGDWSVIEQDYKELVSVGDEYRNWIV
jgi:hypothetical protein